MKLQLSRNQSQHEVSTVEDNSVQRRWSESQFDGDHPPLAEVSVEDDARVNSEPRPGPGGFFLSRVKTEKVEKSPDGKLIKIPPCMNANLTEGI